MGYTVMSSIMTSMCVIAILLYVQYHIILGNATIQASMFLIQSKPTTVTLLWN